MPDAPRTPSLQELFDNALLELQQALAELDADAGLDALDVDLGRENNRVLAYLHAAGVDGNYQYLRQHLAKQVIPTTATGAWLEGWLESYGIERKPAASAAGFIDVTGIDPAIVPAGAQWRSTAGVIYLTDTDTAIGGGVASVPVTAAVGGAHTNAAAGATLTLVEPITDVDPSAVVDGAGLEGGTDRETDAAVRYRLEQRLQNPPLGGAPHDYARWALEVAGITRAWGRRTPAGPCSAGVVIMADDNGANGIPTPTDQQAVEDYILEDGRGPPDELFVIIPTAVTVDIDVFLTPDTQAVRDAVTLELQDLFYRTEPGVDVPHSHIDEAVSVAAGEHTHRIDVPAMTQGGVVAVGGEEIAVLGTIAFLVA